MPDDPPSKVALGLDYARSSVENQFARVNQIQSALGVLLGFVVTAIGLAFAFRRPATAAGFLVDGTALLLLLAAGAIFGFGLAIFRLHRDPEPIRTTIGLDDPSVRPEDAQRRLLERYLRYYEENKRAIRRRFLLVNAGIAMMLAGIVLLALANLVR